MKALLAGERPVIRSGGLMERDYLYAEDAVSAYLAVAESLDRPELHGRAWNASIGSPVTVLEIVRRLAEIAGTGVEPDVRGDGTPHGELTSQWLDSSAITEQLGWTPAWDLQRGLEATYRWYEQELPRISALAQTAAGQAGVEIAEAPSALRPRRRGRGPSSAAPRPGVLRPSTP